MSIAFLRNTKVREWFWQILLLGMIALLIWFILDNTIQNLARRNMASGFGFLSRTAGFDIEQSPIAWSPTDSYGRALLVGICNTLLVATSAILLATLLGFAIALMRMSSNFLQRATAGTYIEFLRNTPAILQIIFWYFAVLTPLPPPRLSIGVGGVAFLNVRGLFLPKPVFSDGGLAVALTVVGIVATLLAIHVASRVTGWHRRTYIIASLATILLIPVFATLATGVTLHWDIPELRGFNFAGGLRLFPEFMALTLGLSVYTSSFIAEIFRAGFGSVGKGQIEAARALGLRRSHMLALIELPLALRVIIPPLTSQYLSLVKNSSLAVAIGYPEIMHIFAGSVLNQSGQAVEVMAITMLTYLSFSLSISLFMNWYNRRAALVER